MAAMPSTSLSISNTPNLSTQRNVDPRDEWSWNDWGSLEEHPVSKNKYYCVYNAYCIMAVIA